MAAVQFNKEYLSDLTITVYCQNVVNPQKRKRDVPIHYHAHCAILCPKSDFVKAHVDANIAKGALAMEVEIAVAESEVTALEEALTLMYTLKPTQVDVITQAKLLDYLKATPVIMNLFLSKIDVQTLRLEDAIVYYELEDASIVGTRVQDACVKLINDHFNRASDAYVYHRDQFLALPPRAVQEWVAGYAFDEKEFANTMMLLVHMWLVNGNYSREDQMKLIALFPFSRLSDVYMREVAPACFPDLDIPFAAIDYYRTAMRNNDDDVTIHVPEDSPYKTMDVTQWVSHKCITECNSVVMCDYSASFQLFVQGFMIDVVAHGQDLTVVARAPLPAGDLRPKFMEVIFHNAETEDVTKHILIDGRGKIEHVECTHFGIGIRY